MQPLGDRSLFIDRARLIGYRLREGVVIAPPQGGHSSPVRFAEFVCSFRQLPQGVSDESVFIHLGASYIAWTSLHES